MLLPSAKLYGLNVKIALAIMLVAFGAPAWRELVLDDQTRRFARRCVALFAYFALLLACWSLVALQNGFTPLPELRSMLGPAVLIAAYHPRLVPKRWLLGAYAASSVIYAVLKLLWLTGVYLGVVQEFDLVVIGRQVFEIEMVAGPTCRAGLRRLALVNDLAVVMFPLLLLESRYRRAWVYGALVLCGLAVLSSYSRYLMFAFVVICVITALQLGSSRARLAIAGCVVVALALGFAIDGGNCLASRLFPLGGLSEASAAAGVSSSGREADPSSVTAYRDGTALNRQADEIRRMEFHRLTELIGKQPLFGYGVGSYDRGYVRSPQMPYSYELQLLSFVLKFGIVGFALIACGAIALCALLFGRQLLPWAGTTALAASGLANPFYESSAFGVAFVLLVASFSDWAVASRERPRP